MLSRKILRRREAQLGASLIEALVAILIVSFGLMALAGLHTRMNAAVLESYQRAQALTMLQNMVSRMQANQPNIDAYITTGNTVLGTGDDPLVSCPAGTLTQAQEDRCEWSKLLKGASELKGTDPVGAMIGGRGCIARIQAADPTSNVCQPAIYRVSVVWQGFNATTEPAITCGSGQFSGTGLRKVVSTQVLVPLPSCS